MEKNVSRVCVSGQKWISSHQCHNASAGLCVCYVSLQANGGRHRASLKGTQIDCLLAVSAPIWWSPKIKTSFFSSQDARRQQSSQAWFSFLSINTSHLHHSSVALFTLYRVKNGLAVDYISSVDEYLCVFDNRLIWSHHQWQSMWIPQILLYMCSHILLCGLLNYVDDHGLAMLFSTATDQSLIQMLWKIKKCTMAGWF